MASVPLSIVDSSLLHGNAASRGDGGLSVLDAGEDIQTLCKQTNSVSLPTGVTIAYQIFELGEDVKPEQQNAAIPISADAISLQAKNDPGAGPEPSPLQASDGADRFVMIMGLAAQGRAWLPSLKALHARLAMGQGGEPRRRVQVLVFDNRGVGASSVPQQKTSYSTTLMAQDTLALMDHVGWPKAHVVGHSMGGMIACRLAANAPERVASLTLISSTAGGSDAVNLNGTVLRLMVSGLWVNDKDPHVRAGRDLTCHFSRQLLHSKDDRGRRIKDVLRDEYIANFKAHGQQPKHGTVGQIHAVFSHGLTDAEYKKLAEAPFPIKVIHGLQDIIAAPRRAARLAKLLGAPLIMLPHSAHFTPRDALPQVTDELMEVLQAVRRGAPRDSCRGVHVRPDTDADARGGLCGCMPALCGGA